MPLPASEQSISWAPRSPLWLKCSPGLAAPSPAGSTQFYISPSLFSSNCSFTRVVGPHFIYFCDVVQHLAQGLWQELVNICWNVCEIIGASVVAQMVKNLPVVQETQVQSLDWEDPLEEGMATQPSILVWRIPWTEEPGRLQYIDHK